MKKSPEEIGEVDGEIVDANKIETALRTVGVALRDSSGQFRDLDDVFIELSSKWNDLDKNTQRYIATVAAGSRQQSRFIAMMQDYGRTQELVAAANNSAGAADKQYGKTLDSLQTSLTRLKNAWDEFSMSFADNDFIKGAVDALSKLLEIINKITGNSGLLKLAVIIPAMTGADKAITAFRNNLITRDDGSKGNKKTLRDTIKGTIGDLYKSRQDKKAKRTQKISELEQQFKSEKWAAEELDKAIKNLTDDIKTQKDVVAAFDLANPITAQAVDRLEDLTDAERDNLKIRVATGEISGKEIIQWAQQEEFDRKLSKAIESVTQARKDGLGSLISKIALNKAEVASDKLVALGLMDEKVAAEAAAQGFWKLVAAEIAAVGWIALIVAAIAGVVAALVALGQAAHDNSLNARLEEAESGAENAKKAADQASEAFNDLLSKKTEYDEAQDQLKKLTVGTKEWKDQLIATNSTVLALIDAIPELNEILQIGNNGELILDEESFKTIINNKEQQSKATNAASSIANAYVSRLKREALAEDNKKITRKTVSTFGLDENGNITTKTKTIQLNTKELQQLADAYAYSEQSAIQFGESLGYTAEDMQKVLIDLQEYFNKNTQLLNQEISQLTAANLQFLAQEDLGTVYGTKIAQAVATRPLDEYEEDTKKLLRSTRWWNYTVNYARKNPSSGEEVYQKIAEKYDLNLELLGGFFNRNQDLKDLYSKMTGIDVKDLADYSKRDLAKLITNKYYADESGELTARLAANARKLNQQDQRTYSSLLNQDTNGLTRSGIKKLGDNAKEAGTNMARAFGLSYDEFLQTFYEGNEEAWERSFNTTTRQFKTAMEQALRNAVSVGIEGSDIDDSLPPEVLAGFADKLALAVIGNKEFNVSRNFTNEINSLGLKDEQKETFYSALSAVDWTDANAWRSFADSIKEMYPNISSDRLDNFVSGMIEYNHAINKMSWEEVNKRLQTVNKTLHDIDSGGQKRIFDDESYKALTEAIPDLADQFIQNYDGSWTYLGDSMDLLRESVDKAKEVLDERIKLTNAQLGLADLAGQINKVVTGGKTGHEAWEFVDWTAVDELNRTGKVNLLQQVVNNANATGFDLSSVGIEGLSNELEITSSTPQELIDTMLNGIAKIVNDRDALKAESDKNLQNDKAQAITSELTIQAAKEIFDTVKNRYDIRANDYFGDNDTMLNALLGYYRGYQSKLIANGYENADFTKYNTLLKELEDSLGSGGMPVEALEALNKIVLETNQTSAINEFTTQFQDIYKNLQDALDNYTGSGTTLDKTIEDNVLRMFGLEGLSGTDRDQAIAALLAMSHGDPAGYFALLELDKTNKKLTTTYLDQNGNEQIYHLEDMTFRVLTGNQDLESSYSWLINQNEQINALIRQREFLEKKYQMALEDTNYDYTELQQLTKNQFALLEKENNDYLETIANQSAKIDELYRDASDAAKNLVQYDPSTGALVMSSDYDSATDTLREEADRLYNKVKEATDAEWDAVSKLQENVSLMRELRDRGRDQFIELENTIRDGIVTLYEKNIEAMENSNNAITEANSKLLESMRKSIDEDRQARDNAKTEQDIEDQQRRLAYLQQDSSGANQQEILQLQKSIDEAQQSYQDSLVDQALQKLEDANQIAEEQRQEQIEIAREQLQYVKDNGLLWEQIGNLSDEDKIRIWKASGDFGSMSPEEQKLKLEQFQASIELANSWLKENGSLDTSINQFTDAIDRFVGVFGEMPTDTNSSGVDAFNKTNLSTLKQLVEWLEDPNEGWPVIHDAVERSYGTAPSNYATNGGTINNDSHDTYTYYIEATDRTDEEVEEIMTRVITKKTGQQPVLLS